MLCVTGQCAKWHTLQLARKGQVGSFGLEPSRLVPQSLCHGLHVRQLSSSLLQLTSGQNEHEICELGCGSERLLSISVPCINNLAYGATSCSRTLTSYGRTLLIPSWRECSSSPSTLPLNPCVVSRHKANHAFSHCLISFVSNQEKLPFFHHAWPRTRALCERFTCQEWVDLGQPFSRSLTP